MTPDGSPVPVYLALPAGNEPAIIDAAVPPGARILELGCGVGRLTRVLLALGHQVTAVDESAVMLAHVTGARSVHAPIAGLRLGERFDAVVLASHLINAAGRADLLATCAAHAEPSGVVLVQRFDPVWSADPTPGHSALGPVTVGIEVEPPVDGVFAAVARYTLGTRTWEQPFTASHLPDELLQDEAGEAGLRLTGWADEARTWAVLEPA